ncbi:helix-turn-helix transcriptional regulator [Luedemannella helvata]|uniref:HTH luxR-type domain-containing protein n=1 Tax=Luedemannella helvata TaxID=349315 RepID=A0ABP4VZT4_9ACTN
MSTEEASTPTAPPSRDDHELLIDELLADASDTTGGRLLAAASGGDPVMMRALVLIAVGLGELTRVDGRWRWNTGTSRSGRLAGVLEDRSTALSDRQLVALRAVTEGWVRPYELVAAELEHRAAPGTRVCPGLTPRQRQVLTLLGDGLTVDAIARRLYLSPRTVGKHLERVYRRLGTSDRLTTVLQAKRLGLLGPADGGEPVPGAARQSPLAHPTGHRARRSDAA